MAPCPSSSSSSSRRARNSVWFSLISYGKDYHGILEEAVDLRCRFAEEAAAIGEVVGSAKPLTAGTGDRF